MRAVRTSGVAFVSSVFVVVIFFRYGSLQDQTESLCIWRYLETKQQSRVSSANFSCTSGKFSDFMLTIQVA